MFIGISGSGTSTPIIQIGDSGGFEVTGYTGSISGLAGTAGTVLLSDGFNLTHAASSNAFIYQGSITLKLADQSSNTWEATISTSRSDGPTTHVGSGTKALSAALTQIRLTTQNGTDTFDAGSMNVLFE